VRSRKEIQLLEALEAAASSRGFEIVDLEQTGSGRNALLRVYIDRPEGLCLDDIARANTWVAEVVEGLDPYKGSYTLELSSPGIDRPLRTLAHFERSLGQEVALSLDAAPARPDAVAGENRPRLKYTGVITAVDPEKQLITLEADGRSYELEFAHIKKARIQGRVDFEGRKDS
jgi:ribosome maturation factor RimP